MENCCHAPLKTETTPDQSTQWLKVGIAGLIAGFSMIFSLSVNLTPPEGLTRTFIHSILALSAFIVFALVGIDLLREAAKQIKSRRIGIEQFFLVGIGGAFGASLYSSITGVGDVYYEVVSVLLAIYTFGSLIGETRREAALKSAQEIHKEFESCLKLDRNQQTTQTTIDQISSGDVILVKAGQPISVDGTIIKGTAFIREAPLTGEPFPIVKRQGDKVYAGSVALDQSLIVEASVSGRNRRIDSLLAAVEEARERPTSLQTEAEKIVSWFLPTVLIISVLTFLAWSIFSDWHQALFNALAVLVVACPCAMGLATPIGLWSALGKLLMSGIVARSGDFIEKLAQVNTVVFDKTGTLSAEQMTLVDFVSRGPFTRETVGKWVSAVESSSDHPIAKAFHGWVKGNGSGNAIVRSENIPGVGLAAYLEEGKETLKLEVGNSGLLNTEDREKELVLRDQLKIEAQGTHEIFIKVNEELVGLGILKESLRSSAQESVRLLKKNKIGMVVMTGDSSGRADALGFENVYSELLPEEKATLVRGLQAENQKLLYVGDGINDAPALAEANTSIALNSGTPLARETADAELFGTNLEAIPHAIELSKRVVRGIRSNLIFAALYNMGGISLAAAGVLHPIAAAFLMMFSSVVVSWRALRFSESIHSQSFSLNSKALALRPEDQNNLDASIHKPGVSSLASQD